MMNKKNHSLAMTLLLLWVVLIHFCSPVLEASDEPNGGWNPLFSPDGEKVAFLSSPMHLPGLLWVMNADGSGLIKLTTNGVQNISWSKDGTSLFFSRWGERTANQWEIKPGSDGGATKVLSVPDSALDFSFSPGRTLVAYLLASGSQRNLWIRKTRGDMEMQLTDSLHVRSMTWSNDGKKLFIVEGRTYGEGLWALDLENGSLQNLARGYCGNPVYSPQGDRVAYAFPWKQAREKQGKFGIRVMNPDGSGRKDYQAPHLDSTEIRWIPDGSSLSYMGPEINRKSDEQSQGKSHGERTTEKPEEIALWQLNLEKGQEKRLSPQGFSIASFSWSPDARKIILGGAGEESFGSEIWRLDTATQEFHPLVRGSYAEWLPTSSPEATRIAFLSNRNRKGMLVITDDSGKEIRRFDPLPILGNDRIVWLFNGKVLFLFNSSGFQVVDAGQDTQLNLQIKPKFDILEMQPSLMEEKVLLNAVQDYSGVPQIYLLAGKGGTMEEIGLDSTGVELQPRWSFDGKMISYTDGTDLWLMDGNGKNRKRLTPYRKENENPGLVKKWIDRFKGGPSQSFVSDPFWSPDGSRIGYILTVYDQEEDPRREIRWIAPDGSTSGKIYSERIAAHDQTLVSDRTTLPFFDIEGERIIFTSMVKSLPNLRSVRLAGKTVTTLTETGAFFPALLPERDEIVYTSIEGNQERLMVMELDGSNKRAFLTPSEMVEKEEARKTGVLND